MKDLFSKTQEERLAEERETLRLEEKLSRLERELDLFRHPGWVLFEQRLIREIESGQSALVTCELDKVDGLRERIKLARHLVAVPEQVRAELANLTVSDETQEGA